VTGPLALAFGPALLRSIQRFTKRLEVTWLAPGSSVAPALVGDRYPIDQVTTLALGPLEKLRRPRTNGKK